MVPVPSGSLPVGDGTIGDLVREVADRGVVAGELEVLGEGDTGFILSPLIGGGGLGGGCEGGAPGPAERGVGGSTFPLDCK
jgi:hypothetical protein